MTRDRDSRLVYSTGGGKPAKGPAPPPAARAAGGKGIRVRVETKAAGRTVTAVYGLSGTDAEIEALCRGLKSACSAGGGVKDGVVELQGDQKAKAKAFLAARGLKASG